MATNKLTDLLIRAAIRKAHEEGTSLKKFDGNGGYLHINTKPAGTDLWKHKLYLRDGSETTLSYGAYPTVTLAEFRVKREATRKAVADGENPMQAKREKRQLAKAQREAAVEE
ncbi:MAG: Arm DNA-binding domain-containing protein, partial [Pseudomonadota bacterium]|nr:Arm DNA-binding domain-containing protein [Pseudomonadota bacterium]